MRYLGGGVGHTNAPMQNEDAVMDQDAHRADGEDLASGEGDVEMEEDHEEAHAEMEDDCEEEDDDDALKSDETDEDDNQSESDLGPDDGEGDDSDNEGYANF